jgi:1-phosphofructokinase family hexose kinase
MRFDQFKSGEVNRATEVHRLASGKVINVAIAVAHLRESVEAISLIGRGDRESIDRELSAFDVSRNWILSNAPMRSCLTILDAGAQQTTELVENAPPVTAAELAEFAAVFAHKAAGARVAVLTGSLPQGAPVDFFATLMKQVTCPIILDARGPELLAALPHRPWLVKPNREELGLTLECSINSDAALQAGMEQLAGLGAQRVLVTEGARPAWLLDERCVRIAPPQLTRIVNPIGCGDCLAAGIAVGNARGMSPLESVTLGMAAAADNATKLLSPRLDLDSVHRFCQQVQVIA